MAEVQLLGVAKRYPTRNRTVEAVTDVSFRCEDGEFLVLLGPSGCGKTSLLRLIAGLEMISAGEILIGGRPVNRLKPGARNVSMAFENYSLYPPLTVRENIAFPLKARKIEAESIESKIRSVVHTLRLEGVLDKKPGQLSGGLQQKVSLARCLARDADVHLMDEPLSHIDTEQRLLLREELKSWQRRTGRTVIFVTHDQMEAMALADRIAVIQGGRLVQIGSPEDIYCRPLTLFVAGFIGEPPMNFIEGMLDRMGHQPVFRSSSGQIRFNVQPGFRVEGGIGSGPRPVILGIRPEDVEVVAGKADEGWIGEVEVVESFGEEDIVQLRCGLDRLAALVPPSSRVQREGRAMFHFDPAAAFFFDPESGRRC
jgi:multiple sugar transport system ATP-binding protein